MRLKRFLTGPSTTTPAFLPILLGLMLMLAFLAGCGGTTPARGEFNETPVEVIVKVPYQCGQPPPVDPVQMRDIEWNIVQIDGEDYFALSVADYQALGLNTSDFIAAGKQMRGQRDFYRDCIARSIQETHDENVDAGLVPDIPTE